MAILNYSDFVTTTFASAAHHTRHLQSLQNPSLTQDQRSALGDIYQALVDELNLRLDRLHVGMAFAGEMLEYQIELEGVKSSAPFQDTSAEMKEVGDLCYYLQMIINLYDLPGITLEGAYEEPKKYPNYSVLSNVSVKAEALVDQIKRFEIYRQEYSQDKMVVAVEQMVHALKELAVIYYDQPMTSPLMLVIQQNIEKLKKRYPKGTFDTADSAAKKDAVTS